MNNSIEKKLNQMPTTQLVEMVQAALATMSESMQISFIAKYIDAKSSLARLGADDPVAFSNEVEAFCLNCLNGEYYSDENDIETYFSENRYDDSYYDDDWDYDEYFSNTEWAGTFERLLELSMMYIQSGDIETGHETMSRLLSCLKEMMSSESFLGTSEPISHISVDWDELFALSFVALFQFHSDSNMAIKLAFRRWLDFGSCCDEGFLSNVKDILTAEHYVIEEIKKSKSWSCQRKCFELLERLYKRLEKSFDKKSLALALTNQNIFFNLMVVDGLYEEKNWIEAIETACSILPKIQQPHNEASIDSREARTQKEIRTEIQSKLADAYEQLSDFKNSFETLKQMFEEAPSFALYKRTRILAEKADSVYELFEFAEKLLKKGSNACFMRNNLLRDIYSFEGKTCELLAMAKSEKIGTNYYDRKYIALSLIYRAASTISDVEGCLSEYLSNSAGQDGIGDMLLSDDDSRQCEALLLQGVDLLKGIVAFHINAATRNRYAKAAYYMCVMRDIFTFLENEDAFRGYFKDVIQQNSRRPALRDEMSIVYGREATVVKK
jgi:hypothetical protein